MRRLTKAPRISRIGAVLLSGLTIVGCGNSSRDQTANQPVSYASREPNSDAVPTNETSFELLKQDPPTRLEILREMIVQSGRRCSTVTRGVFADGLDGTDEWRVGCVDSGSWQVWFKPAGAREIVECSNSECSEARPAPEPM